MDEWDCRCGLIFYSERALAHHALTCPSADGFDDDELGIDPNGDE